MKVIYDYFIDRLSRNVNVLFTGDECTTKANEPGICKSIANCMDYFMMMKSEHGNNLLNILKLCTPNKDTIICCKSELESPTTQSPATQSPAIQSHTTPLFKRSELACQSYQRLIKNYPKENKICLGNNIIGAEDADINEFPHMAAIGYEKENSLDYEFLCGGTLISEKYILTAVHCVNKRNQVPRFARLGKVNKAHIIMKFK